MKNKFSSQYFRIFLFDRYYNKMFLKNLIIFVVLFICVYFFCLFLTQLPSFLKKSSYNKFITLPHILQYYYYLLPFYVNTTIPFSFLFSMSYSLGLFYSHNEALTLVASGISITRLVTGSIFISFILSVLLIIANTTVFPTYNKIAADYETKMNIASEHKTINNLQIRDDNQTYYFGRYFLSKKNEFHHFLILKEINQFCTSHDARLNKNFIPDKKQLNTLNFQKQKDILVSKDLFLPKCFNFKTMIRGSVLSYAKENKFWTAHQLTLFSFNNSNASLDKVEKIDKMDLKETTFSPEIFKQEIRDVTEMSISECFEYLDKLKSHNEPIESFFVDFIDQKLLAPLSIVFLACFAANLGRFFSRKHLFIFSLLSSFTIAFVFLILINIGYSFVRNKTFPLIGVSFGYVSGFFIYFYLRYRRLS